MNTQELFKQFSDSIDAKRGLAKTKEVLHYIDTTPFQEDYWKDWKKLFKMTEEALRAVKDWDDPVSHQLLTLMVHFLIRLDQQNIQGLKGKYPTKLTMRYMKRRGRRVLWFLAKEAPHWYRMVAEKILLAQEQPHNAPASSLDYENHWISFDIILGKSRRYYQKGHGQGGYAFYHHRFQLHHREEGVSQVWDWEFGFLHQLIRRNFPWQIHEFAVKILMRNQQAFQTITNERLVAFFGSPSVWLKRATMQYIDQHAATTEFPPELIAHRWFYGNFDINAQLSATSSTTTNPSNSFIGWMNKFLGINASETKSNSAWYRRFTNELYNLVIDKLKKGQRSRRIVRAIDFLHKRKAFQISSNEVQQMAETLFELKSEVTRDIVWRTAKKSDIYQMAYWLGIVRHSDTHVDQLLSIYRKRLNNFRRTWWDRGVFEGYMFVEHPKVIDFGWEMTERYLRVHEVTQIWQRLLRNRQKNARNLLRLNIKCPKSIQWFTASHANQMDHLYAYTPEKIAFIVKEGLPPIRELLLNQITQVFEFNPLIFLYLVTCLPHQARENILEKCLPKFSQHNVLFDVLADNQMLPHLLGRLQEHAWGLNALLQIVANSKTDLDEVSLFVEEMFKEDQRAELLIQFLVKMNGSANQDYFVEAIARKPLVLVKYSHLIPGHFWLQFLQQVPEEHLDKFQQVLAQVALKLDAAILKITHPVFASTLINWLNHHRQTIDFQSNALFEVCVHRLPEVRNWGFGRTNELGLRANFALRLLESELPEAVNFGQQYFAKAATREDSLVEDLLTLCDSPVAATRSFGLELLQSIELDPKKHAQLLAYLSEHADAKIQEYVSVKLLDASPAASKPFVKTFDRSVLRRKNRNKTARENVKKRWSQQAEVDVNTLLELAKTGSKQDAEWAIFELTKLSLQGQEIEGFVLE
ncbi:hypothetical protein BKI52_20390 [marine bacterium AO1-C]|nr:hypothetical protein BKI52_20390 [marine bacterium AO1-C]